VLNATGGIRVQYRQRVFRTVGSFLVWIPGIVPAIFVLCCLMTSSHIISTDQVARLMNRSLVKENISQNIDTTLQLDVFQRGPVQKASKPVFTPLFVRNLMLGGRVYVVPALMAIVVTLIFSLSLVSCRFWLQESSPHLAGLMSRLPNMMMETLPQIFWLFLISRFVLDASSRSFYFYWLTIIALTYSPILTDQLVARVERMRKQNYILAEKVVGEKRWKTFFRDIVLLQCWDVLVVQVVYLFGNILVMESCMDFLANIFPPEPSIGSLLSILYKELSEGSIMILGLEGFFSRESGPFWVTLILLVSTVLTLRNVAASLENRWK